MDFSIVAHCFPIDFPYNDDFPSFPVRNDDLPSFLVTVSQSKMAFLAPFSTSHQDPRDIASWIDVADAGVLVDLNSSAQELKSANI